MLLGPVSDRESFSVHYGCDLLTLDNSKFQIWLLGVKSYFIDNLNFWQNVYAKDFEFHFVRFVGRINNSVEEANNHFLDLSSIKRLGYGNTDHKSHENH